MSIFFLGSWGMNRSAEQTDHPRTASWFTQFVYPALRFIPYEPRQKYTHSLINCTRTLYMYINLSFNVFVTHYDSGISKV